MNREKLLAEMVLRKKKACDLCVDLGISRSALYRKLNGVTPFTVPEAQTITKVLRLDKPEQIFFEE